MGSARIRFSQPLDEQELRDRWPADPMGPLAQAMVSLLQREGRPLIRSGKVRVLKMAVPVPWMAWCQRCYTGWHFDDWESALIQANGHCPMLPETMTEPVSFDMEPDDRPLRKVKWRRIDESEEHW